MNNRVSPKLIFLLLTYGIIFSSCNNKHSSKINELLNSYKAAVNNHDYDNIKPYLSNDFSIYGVDKNASLILLYAYIKFNQSKKISQIKLRKSEQLNDTTLTIYGKQYFTDGSKSDIIISCQLISENLKISKIIHYLPKHYNLTTRASYVTNEIFGDDRVENIKNLKIIDLSSGDSIKGPHYTTYYDSLGLKKYAKTALNLFEKFDSILINSHGFYDVERENLFLTYIHTKNTCTVGNSSKIPWTMALYEADSINNKKLINKIGNTFSHEIVEGCLVVKYNLKDIRFRWFRDGLSEYIAYKFCLMFAPEEAANYFITNRLSDATRHKQNGSLLDWRGDAPIKELDKGKIYGDRFIYFNEVGQYGRAFKLFKDLFENNPNQISDILQKIRLTENITVDELLIIMNDVTNKNIIELIDEY